jgi:hypothetical protein
VITSWKLVSSSVQFLFAINGFLICVSVEPEAHDNGPIDLEDFFYGKHQNCRGSAGTGTNVTRGA